jgi:hypothetical protein
MAVEVSTPDIAKIVGFKKSDLTLGVGVSENGCKPTRLLIW